MSTSKARLQHPMITCYRISDLCIRMLLVFVILFGTVHTINEDNVQLSTSTLVKPQILIPANAEMNFPKQSALTADQRRQLMIEVKYQMDSIVNLKVTALTANTPTVLLPYLTNRCQTSKFYSYIHPSPILITSLQSNTVAKPGDYQSQFYLSQSKKQIQAMLDILDDVQQAQNLRNGTDYQEIYYEQMEKQYKIVQGCFEQFKRQIIEDVGDNKAVRSSWKNVVQKVEKQLENKIKDRQVEIVKKNSQLATQVKQRQLSADVSQTTTTIVQPQSQLQTMLSLMGTQWKAMEVKLMQLKAILECRLQHELYDRQKKLFNGPKYLKIDEIKTIAAAQSAKNIVAQAVQVQQQIAALQQPTHNLTGAHNIETTATLSSISSQSTNNPQQTSNPNQPITPLPLTPSPTIPPQPIKQSISFQTTTTLLPSSP